MGGAVAAPVFKRVAEASLRHLGIAPTVNAPPLVLVPGRADGATAVTPISLGGGATKAIPAPDGYMPDLRGLSAREALRTIGRIGMMPKFMGRASCSSSIPRRARCSVALAKPSASRSGAFPPHRLRGRRNDAR